MNIDLIAMMKTTEDFIENYKEGDVEKIYDGRSLIFYALSNTDVDTRYAISNILLNDGVDVLCKNSENHTVLHILLVQWGNRIPETYDLCKKFLDLGVDINARDNHGQTALHYIINMGGSEEELKPLYDLWFSHEGLDLSGEDKFGQTILEFAEHTHYKYDVIERIRKYSK